MRFLLIVLATASLNDDEISQTPTTITESFLSPQNSMMEFGNEEHLKDAGDHLETPHLTTEPRVADPPTDLPDEAHQIKIISETLAPQSGEIFSKQFTKETTFSEGKHAYGDLSRLVAKNVPIIYDPRAMLKLFSLPSLHLVAFGDWGNRHNIKPIKSINSYLCDQQQQEIDSVLLLGDNFYSNGIDPKLGFKDPRFDMFKKTLAKNLQFPFYPILGNHDILNGKEGTQFQLDYGRIESRWKMKSDSSFYF